MDLFKNPTEKLVTIGDLQQEIKNLKREIQSLKIRDDELEIKLLELQGHMIIREQHTPTTTYLPSSSEVKINKEEEEGYIGKIDKMISHKWYTKIKLIIKDTSYEFTALVDSGADLNCIQEGLIPTQYYEKTKESLRGANGHRLQVSYKLSRVKICKDQVCFKTSFLLVKNINEEIILGTPFLTLLYPFKVNRNAITTTVLNKEINFEFLDQPKIKDLNAIQDKSISFLNQITRKQKQIGFISKEIYFKRIEDQLKAPIIKEKIDCIIKKFSKDLCSEQPNAFWKRKIHVVSLPYDKEFKEINIPTKARPIQMNQQNLDYCKKEIRDYLDKGLIRPSKSPWSCSAFYVSNASELERGSPRLVINYKPLNTTLRWIRYPLPNKRDLIKLFILSSI